MQLEILLLAFHHGQLLQILSGWLEHRVITIFDMFTIFFHEVVKTGINDCHKILSTLKRMPSYGNCLFVILRNCNFLHFSSFNKGKVIGSLLNCCIYTIVVLVLGFCIRYFFLHFTKICQRCAFFYCLIYMISNVKAWHSHNTYGGACM